MPEIAQEWSANFCTVYVYRVNIAQFHSDATRPSNVRVYLSALVSTRY